MPSPDIFLCPQEETYYTRKWWGDFFLLGKPPLFYVAASIEMTDHSIVSIKMADHSIAGIEIRPMQRRGGHYTQFALRTTFGLLGARGFGTSLKVGPEKQF